MLRAADERVWLNLLNEFSTVRRWALQLVLAIRSEHSAVTLRGMLERWHAAPVKVLLYGSALPPTGILQWIETIILRSRKQPK